MRTMTGKQNDISNDAMTVMRSCASVCPICLKRIPAQQVKEIRTGKVYLKKSCPEHGHFRTLIWNGLMDIDAWRGNTAPMMPHDAPGCPERCGLCENHLRGTCCVLLEVTERCNFHCRFCFADAEKNRPADADRSLADLKKDVEGAVVSGVTLLQLSGGEPTMRDDLPELVRYASHLGCKYIQLNTNGRRLVEEPAYLKELADAGLSFVFLQFDGTEDAIYETLRGQKLFEEKQRVIEVCGKAGLGVTLVSTVVPGVNDGNVGQLIRFGIAHSPYVRGVHFQPVSYFGRIPGLPQEADRYTLDRLITDVVSQSGGLIDYDHLAPSCCDHPLCGFHGDFVVMPGGRLFPLTSHKLEAEKPPIEDGKEAADRNREFVGRRWKRMPDREVFEKGSKAWGGGAIDMLSFLQRASTHGFTITCMAFQDAGNLELERLRRCSLHVYKDGKHIPFCKYYLSRQ